MPKSVVLLACLIFGVTLWFYFGDKTSVPSLDRYNTVLAVPGPSFERTGSTLTFARKSTIFFGAQQTGDDWPFEGVTDINTRNQRFNTIVVSAAAVARLPNAGLVIDGDPVFDDVLLDPRAKWQQVVSPDPAQQTWIGTLSDQQVTVTATTGMDVHGQYVSEPKSAAARHPTGEAAAPQLRSINNGKTIAATYTTDGIISDFSPFIGATELTLNIRQGQHNTIMFDAKGAAAQTLKTVNVNSDPGDYIVMVAGHDFAWGTEIKGGRRRLAIAEPDRTGDGAKGVWFKVPNHLVEQPHLHYANRPIPQVWPVAVPFSAETGGVDHPEISNWQRNREEIKDGGLGLRGDYQTRLSLHNDKTDLFLISPSITLGGGLLHEITGDPEDIILLHPQMKLDPPRIVQGVDKTVWLEYTMYKPRWRHGYTILHDKIRIDPKLTILRSPKTPSIGSTPFFTSTDVIFPGIDRPITAPKAMFRYAGDVWARRTELTRLREINTFNGWSNTIYVDATVFTDRTKRMTITGDDKLDVVKLTGPDTWYPVTLRDGKRGYRVMRNGQELGRIITTLKIERDRRR